MAPVSSFLHCLCVRILHYLDNWLILASSFSKALWARDAVLNLCLQRGIVVNESKSHLTPSQSATYLGMVIRSRIFKAFRDSGPVFCSPATDGRISVLRRTIGRVMEESPRLSFLPLPSCSGGLSTGSVPATCPQVSLGLSGLVRLHSLDSCYSRRPSLVVGQTPPSGGGSTRPAVPGPAVLVRCLGPGLGSSPSRLMCARPLVASGASPVNQFVRIAGHSSGSRIFNPFCSASLSGFSRTTRQLCLILCQGGTFFLVLNEEESQLLP